MPGAMTTLGRLLPLILLVPLAAPAVAPAKRTPKPVCPGGRFVLPAGAEPLVAGAPAGVAEMVVLDDSGTKPTVATASGCAPTPAKLRATRKGTTLAARWKRCQTVRKATLAGRFDTGCATFSGTFKAKGQKARRVQATRSACGDGVLDAAGGEQCESPGAACAAGSFCDVCRCIPDVFAPENAYGGPPPADAAMVTPDELAQLARNGAEIVTVAGLAAAEVEEAARVEADRQLVAAAIARDPRIGKGLEVTPPPNARSSAGGIEVDLITPAGIRPVVLHGSEFLMRSAAAALRNFPTRANQELMYRTVYDGLPPDQREGLPPPDELAGFSDEAVADLRAEVVRRADDVLPNTGPPEAEAGVSLERGVAQAEGECSASFYGLRHQTTWPLESYTTAVKDQAGRGTCAAHGAAAGLEAYLWKWKGRPVINLSEQELYGRAKGRWFPSDYDEGLPTENLIEEMDERDAKIRTENAWLYNPSWDRVEDDDDETYTHSCDGYTQTCSNRNHQLGLSCSTVNGSTTCTRYTHPEYTADSSATHELRDYVSLWNGFEPENSLQNVRAYLAQGYPVVFAFDVDEQFKDASKDDPWVTYPNGDDIGGHAVLMTGYKSAAFVDDIYDAPSGYGGHFYIIKNSWGCDYGDAGYVYVHTDWVIEHAKSATAIVGSATSGLPSISLAASKSLVTSGGSMTLSATGNNLEKVEFYEGFTKIRTDLSPPFEHTITYDASDNSNHYYFARGYDPVGDFVDSNVVQVKVDIDNVPPVVTLSAPSTVPTPPGNVTFIANATDNKGVTKVEFFSAKSVQSIITGNRIEVLTKLGEDYSAPYLFPMQFGGGAAGGNSFRAIAHDAAGNKGKSALETITVVPLVKPFVFTFTATPDSLPVGGGQVTLEWQVAGANSVVIDNGVGNVTGLTSKTVNVTESTGFTLTATNAQGTTTRTVGVNVLIQLKPIIQSFTATPSTLPAGGGQVTLAWGVLGDDSLTIDQGVGDVSGLDQTTVNVTQSTTFTLTATNEAGSNTRTVTVTVDPPPTTTTTTPTTSTTASTISSTTSTSTTSTSSTTVTTLPGGPNLRPTALVPTPVVVDAGAQLQVSWTVANQGGATATATWQDGLWLSPSQQPGGAFYGDTPRTTNLAAGASYTVTRTVTVPSIAPGTYYLVVVTDRGNNVSEAQEGDNQRVSVPITVRTPDLRPTAVDVSATVVDAGGSLDVSWSVTNEGATLALAPWQDGLWLSPSQQPGGTFYGDTPRTTTLAVGAGYTVTRTVAVPNVPPGTYYLVVATDRGNNVYEANDEGDNGLVSVPITVRTPDLRPTAVDVSATVVDAGGSLDVSWSVTNEGATLALAPWQDGLWLSPSQQPGGTFYGDTPRATTLAAGAGYTVTRTVTVPNIPPGTYYLVVATDRGNAVYEAGGENDNGLVSVPITVRAPNLRPTAISATKRGSLVEITWTVTNGGTAPARASWQDGVWISTGQVPGGTFTGDTDRGTDLAPGASYTASKVVNVAAIPAGTYYLVVAVDRGNAVYEGNAESDNTLASSTTVTLP